MTELLNAGCIDWGKIGGLIPAIVQDGRSLRVLMLGYLNEEALRTTLDTGLVTFFSRSKNRLWRKGETSGNVLRLREIKLDCDGDTLLVLVDPAGPTCHTGTRTCFGDKENASLAILADVAATIRARRQWPSPGSYTAQLIERGVARIAQKVGEEALETALAAVTGDQTVAAETADLLYHLLVLLEVSDVDWLGVLLVLNDRMQARRLGGISPLAGNER